MEDSAIARFRRLIEERLANLDADDALGREGQSVVTLDQQAVGRLSRQDALLSQAMSKATQARRDAQRRALLQALDRIREGEFGYCDDCGDDIAEARLALDPSLQRCVGCASGR
ncbi:TraR/DksA family transcriptional regulator [Aestuariicoccus sp. MJ-SS9]|uniref:TraR/DksA family transcriptional regulator n=1 Tax=Aestuariicoccus sp. MJ-SS9 TaxID=3079855 RepID=UPI002909894A|nr:TraR/DksA C4-type zinc finger protein [Aestuariicoccus sp. MJ-SS9]MDU8911060.1 TraR/DksA C4-type zinc finger protein [Aestuariicoccus sp. MJ-SS9]